MTRNVNAPIANLTAPTASPRASADSNKLLGLELIRFLSAFDVLLWHYQHFAFTMGGNRLQQPFYSVLRIFYEYGEYGVQMFWCISGFIFFYKYREPIAAKAVSGWKFFILRFSRLYPLHFATLLLVALLQFIYFHLNDHFFVYFQNNLRHFALQLAMASNWGLQDGDSFNGPIWSISVEVLIYFFFFLILRFVGKTLLINILVVAVCIALEGLRISNPICECLKYFYIGGLAAIVLKTEAFAKYRLALSVVAWCVVCLTPIGIVFFNLFAIKHSGFMFLTFYPPLLLFCAGQNFKVNAPTQRVIEALGNMTYSSYLIHFPLQLTVAIFFSIIKARIPFDSPAFFAGFMAVTLIAAYFIYRYFEAPAQNAIRAKFK